jgi:hypothetical protein
MIPKEKKASCILTFPGKSLIFIWIFTPVGKAIRNSEDAEGNQAMIFGRKKKKKPGEAPSLGSWAFKRAILVLVLALVLFFGVRSCYHFLTGWNAKMHKNFTGLPMGSLAKFAEESLGSPVRMSDYELETMPVQDYKDLYNEAKRSGAVKFYYYENGMRILYILGFDAKGKMVFKKLVKA